MAATLPFDDLPPSLQKSLQATATITVAELHNEGMAAANNPQEWPFAQISEILDHRTCPLCRRVDGMILRVGTPEYAKWRAPSHINCRRTLIYIGKDEQNVRVDFEEPPAELIQRHGHYHLNPEKHAELRIPAEPAGRHVVLRRVKNLETGERSTRLDWAPWHEEMSAAKQELILQARVAKPEALPGILKQLGITDPEQPEQFAAAVRLGLRDRLAGWVTTSIAPPASTLQLVEAAEAEIASLKSHEVAIAWDQEGTEIIRKSGAATSVEFDDDEMRALKDAVLTHNHPYGSAFSPDDWRLAVKANVQELRAIGSNDLGELHVYILSRPPQGWDRRYAEVETLVLRIHGEVQTEFWAQIRAGTLSKEEASRRHWHEVATRAAEELGWDYRRIRIE